MLMMELSIVVVVIVNLSVVKDTAVNVDDAVVVGSGGGSGVVVLFKMKTMIYIKRQ